MVQTTTMATNIAFNLVRIGINLLICFLLAVTVFFLGTSIIQFSENTNADNLTGSVFRHHVVGGKENTGALVLSADGKAGYQRENHYTVQVVPRTSLGVYGFGIRLMLLVLGLAALWQLRKVFRKGELADPFNDQLIKRLKRLALLFIISDIIIIAHNVVFNGFMRNKFPGQNFQLWSTVGEGIITGLIILTITIVLQRGKEIKEEHALTV